MSDHELPPATSMGEIDVHMRYMRNDIRRLVEGLAQMAVRAEQMATKSDIAELSRKFEGYATHDDVRALRTDVELLRSQVETGSVPGQVKKWAEWAQRLSAIAAFLAVGAVAVAHLVEKLK